MDKKIIFDKKNVIVAGGAGFIGSHLCDELIKEAKVICIDNFSTGSEKNIDHLLSNPDFTFINHDLSEPIDLEEINTLKRFKISFQGIQEVYNLACPMSPDNFLENKLDIINANSLVMKVLLDIASKYESKFMQFSSSVVYGFKRKELRDYQVTETDMGQVSTTSDRSCYDEGKRFAETLVHNYREQKHIDAKIMRVFRTFGPRMTLGDGQMIPDMVANALEGKDLEIYGDENFSSSLCFVSDIIDATLKFMESDLAGPFNIGSDVDVNITDLAKKIIETTESDSKIVYKKSKLFMTPLLTPDIHKARNELGWMPITTLDNGLKKTIFDLRTRKRLRKM
ncbi:GDP-mannose 4,6-dehydratase [Patescibacteria group bacterium]|nr:GDP-mannose 4,6-dehydratase [Patescibacteria group bacterium]